MADSLTASTIHPSAIVSAISSKDSPPPPPPSSTSTLQASCGHHNGTQQPAGHAAPTRPPLRLSTSAPPPPSRLSPPQPQTPPPPTSPPPAGEQQHGVPIPRHKTSQTWPRSGLAGTSPLPRPSHSPRSMMMARQTSTPVQPASLSSASSTTGSGETAVERRSLMRRVSQKAANKLRRRTSTSHDHEERSGPVLMRHRSGSAAGEEARLGIQHHDDSLDDSDESAIVVDQLDGPPPRPATAGGAGSAPIPGPPQHSDTSVGIIVPDELQRGTAMTRVTRKKKVQRIFALDVNRARVSWDSSKQTSRFYVDDMKDIRTGANARNYREELQVSSESEERWITITYLDPEGGKLKLLHLIAPTVKLFKVWTSTLEAINRYRTEMMAGLAMQGEKFVEAHWRRYMANLQASSSKPVRADRVSFDDVERLCRSIHVNCSQRFLKEKFRRADRDNSGYLNFHEFERFVKLLKERDEIKELWEQVVANPGVGMHRHEFRAFLREVQAVDVDADSAQVDKVFRKFCRQSSKMNGNHNHGHADAAAASSQQLHQHHPEDMNEMRMNREAFTSFLLSSSYNPPLLNATATGQSLERPLNEYYCSSSHNTYLMGRQVRGESSVEGYIKVLQRGCRCVEIDCWDGDDGRPVVTHGHTGTSECLFSDVISAIKKYAFIASPYPVILSLEVHCTLEQQIKMAEMLMAILGESLVTEPFMTNTLVLPSPQDLKHRFLIKVKGSEHRELSMSLKSDFETMAGGKSGSASPPRGGGGHGGGSSGGGGGSGGFFRSSTSSSNNTTSESDEFSSISGDKRKKPPKVATKIAFELGKLGVYCRGQKFRNFALPESKTMNHVFSFQEKSFIKFCKDSEKKAQLEKHNVRYLMRVYPSGFRVNSSNFDPLGFWRRGVQMVALNWQTYDLGVQLNEAMFASGDDKSGYVLKPKSLRGPRNIFDSLADAPDPKLKKEKKRVAFSIQVISAQQLPRPKDHKPEDSIDPFVEVEVFSADDKAKGISTGEGGIDLSDSKGVSGLGAPQKRRTRVVRDDGFHPLFDEKMKFSLVTKFEDLVFLRFSVYDSQGGDDKLLIATYTAKLISLQQGYRHLPLYDVQGEQYLFSTLFVKVQVEPWTMMDRELPQRGSTIETLKTSAKSVLSRGFSSERRSVNRAKGDKDSAKESEASQDERLVVASRGKQAVAFPGADRGEQSDVHLG